METNLPDLHDIFDIRTANEWIRDSKKTPVPKQLFGDFWLEGELAILFADTAKGKSLLAVQIAESVARGRNAFSSPPAGGGVAAASADGVVGEMTAGPQNVLYLDFELSKKQFEMRYSAEHDPAKGDYLKKHYNFSDRFQRIGLKPQALRDVECRSFEAVLRKKIEQLVVESGAKVLIIDNITYLKRAADSSREAAPLMKDLNRLKNELGISILVITHTPKRNLSRPLVVNDMLGSKVLADFADNIFAIGQSSHSSDERYIKHIKPRSSELVFDTQHVPVFRIKKLGGNFLGFEFERFASEKDLVREAGEHLDWDLIDKIKSMNDAGMSVRSIAVELGLSKSTTHRLLHLWEPESVPPAAEGGHPMQKPERERGLNTQCDDHALTNVRASASPHTCNHDNWQSPQEEYSGQFTDQYLVNMGMRPLRKEGLQVENELPAHEDALQKPARSKGVAPDNGHALTNVQASASLPDSLSPYGVPYSKLTLKKDGYGRDIYVEHEDPPGNLMIWYQTNNNAQNSATLETAARESRRKRLSDNFEQKFSA